MGIIIAVIGFVVLVVVLFLSIMEQGDKITDANTKIAQKNDEINQITEKANKEINQLKKDLDDLNAAYDHLRAKSENLANYEEQIAELKRNKNALQRDLEALEEEIVCQMIDISDYENITSEECKNKLSLLKNEINDLIKSGKTIEITDSSKNKKEFAANKKQILLCFISECTNIINNLTFKNVDAARGKIERSFTNINKIFAVDGLQLKNVILEKKLQELTIVYAYLVTKEQEREEQRAIREQMLEEEKVRREIEREKLKIEKEESQFKKEISKLMAYMQKASDIEKQLYIDKIKELEEKLSQLDNDKKNVLEREANTRAGFVYVISNIGSFGENIYKIGMTRRLEPLERVKELGDASVPFSFDVHAMIFSADAPALETALHTTFKNKAVNKVNPRKEFFNVSLEDIEKVVKENHNAVVTFTKVAEAAQYRESLKIAQEQSA